MDDYSDEDLDHVGCVDKWMERGKRKEEREGCLGGS